MIIDSGIATGSLAVSGPLSVTGSTTLNGSLNVTGGVTGSFTGSFYGDGSNLTGLASSASFAAVSSSFAVVSASYSAASGSLSVRVTNLESTASTLTTSSASFAVVSASYSSASGSLSTRVTTIETTYATTGSNTFVGNQTVTGGLFITGNINMVNGADIVTHHVRAQGSNGLELQTSNGTNIVSMGAGGGTQAVFTGSVTAALFSGNGANITGVVTASYAISSSFSTTAINAPYYVTTASYNADSSSVSTRVTTIEEKYATTGSNTFTGTQYISNTTNATTFNSTAALYTDGGLRVTKDAFISGGLSIAGNLNVYGTASVNYVTSSIFVGLNFIDLNTQVPAIRYAGINIGDSGSVAGISSSFWYDSEKDNWIFVYAAQGSQQTSSLAINGPIGYSNLGNEAGLTANYITKAQLVSATNNHHITSSQIYDDGTTVAIAGNLQVTGSFRAANLTGSLNGSNLVAASVANDRLTNSAITIAGTSTALGGSITAATILTGTGVFSGSAQIPATSITNAQLVNSSVTVTAGTGMSGGGAVALGSSVTLTNAGVTSAVAGTGVGVSGATGAVTISIGQAVATSSNVQFNSLGVGTAGSAVVGEIRATADITAFYSSDERLKENITRIEDPIAKIKAIDGVTFSWKEGFDEVHTHKGDDTGVIAQQIEAIGLPDTVTTRENGYKAVRYEKLNALLIEGMKAQQAQIDFLQQQLEELKAILNK
jgi:hypothetical protein